MNIDQMRMFGVQALTAKFADFNVPFLANELPKRIKRVIGPGWVVKVHVQINHHLSSRNLAEPTAPCARYLQAHPKEQNRKRICPRPRQSLTN